ncbi:MAG: XRE family transcriptional regulator [Pseudomonadota bacterium]
MSNYIYNQPNCTERPAKTLVSQAIGRQLRRVRGSLSQAEFARALGLKQQQYQRYESGKRIPPDDVLLKVARYANLDVQTMMALDSGGLLCERSRPLLPEARIVALEEIGQRLRRQGLEDAYVPVPLVSDRAAGRDPALLDEQDVEGYVIVAQSWLPAPGRRSCVRVRDDAMAPALNEGDVVGINHARRDPQGLKGKLIAARLSGQGLIVRYLNGDGRDWILEAENRLHRPVYLPEDTLPDAAEVFVGAVEWCWKIFK